MQVLAHGGGAPEAATILLPLLAVGWFVVRARTGVRRRHEQELQAADRDRSEPPAESS